MSEENLIEGRKIALKALVGSWNYGLNDDQSDKDYKYFVFPTWEDLYTGNRFHAAYTSEDVDYTVHDIRDFLKFLNKVNINFLEVLFSKELTGDQRIIDLFLPFREEFIRVDPRRFQKACYGMFCQKMKSLEKKWDWKQGMDAVRVLLVAARYEAYDSSFEKAFIFNCEEQDYKSLMVIKK